MIADPDNLPVADDLDLEIELSDIDCVPVESERPAVTCVLGREVEAANARLYLHAEAGRALLTHAWSATDREVGGILVGAVHRDRGEFVLATGAIAAKYSQESRAHLTFTHACWQYMLGEQECRFPGTVIVGWYHTHPGYGLFLSGQDLYIHRSFFTLPHQVAVVVDPLADTLALFRMVNGQIVQEPGVPVYGGQVELPRRAALEPLVIPRGDEPLAVTPPRIPSVEEGLDDGVRIIEEVVVRTVTSFGQILERQFRENALPDIPPTGRRIDRRA